MLIFLVLLCIAAAMMMFVPIGKTCLAIAAVATVAWLVVENARRKAEIVALKNQGATGSLETAPRSPEEPTILKFPGVKALLLCCLIGTSCSADEPVMMMHLDNGTRGYCVNPDGSCVQCSLVMCGFHCNDPNASRLLWESEYGPAERGGSLPSRVTAYCDRRGIVAFNVTGKTVDDTLPWCEWAARTGRFAAVGLGTQHFQTLYGFDPNTRTWYVCNNNSTGRIDKYTDAQFRELHRQCMPWCVILKRPSSPPPRFVDWRRAASPPSVSQVF